MEKNVEAIWFEYSGKLKSFIKNRVNDSVVAEDILQEVFIKIHTNIDRLRDEAKIQSWVYQITRNAIADHFKATKKQIRESYNLFEDTYENVTDEVMSEAVGDMMKMMKKLPPANCEALCLTELEGMNQKTYAEKAGISYTAAKTRVHRSRKMLREMLMRCCRYHFDKYGTVLEISLQNVAVLQR